MPCSAWLTTWVNGEVEPGSGGEEDEPGVLDDGSLEEDLGLAIELVVESPSEDANSLIAAEMELSAALSWLSEDASTKEDDAAGGE